MNINECKMETLKHIDKVQFFLKRITDELTTRGINHDKSKLESPEVEIFTEYTPKLATSTYNSEEYKGFLKEMNVALKHHYSVSKHHPEHFRNGIKDMNLIDIVEMLCDWKSATLRHNDGDLIRSIEVNQNRFHYSDEMKQIFKNTAKTLYKYCIEYGCCDGRDETFLGDTIEQIHNKIDDSKLLNDVEKRILKYGYEREFKGKDYYNYNMCIDNGFDVYWTKNYD